MSTKSFEHCLVERIDLPREDTEDGRFYITPKGRFKSVTTILSEKLDKRRLNEWKARVGEEEAQRVSAKALRLGTAIHDIAEKYLLNQPYAGMPLHLDLFRPIKTVLDAHVDQIYGVELPLYSGALKTAGKTDVVAKYNDIVSVIDFKTSSKPKKEENIEGYFLQSTVYSLMFEYMYGIPVPRIVIVMTVAGENHPLVFIKDRNQYINRVISLFNDRV